MQIDISVYSTCLKLLKSTPPTYSCDDTIRYALRNKITFRAAYRELLEGYFIILKQKVSSTKLNSIKQSQCIELFNELKSAWIGEES